MSYAIISVGGKQYRVREGERLLVDRLALEDGATFTPSVLLTGGDGEPQIAPGNVVVTAKVLAQAKGPKIRIGKYKKRTGYKRHTGFRASLTQIEIESIGGGSGRSGAKQAAKKDAPAAEAPRGSPRATRTSPWPRSRTRLPAGTRRRSLRRSSTSRRTRSARARSPHSSPPARRRRANGTQEGPRLLEERSRLPEQAARRQDLRRPAGEGRDDPRAPARDAVPPRPGRRTRPRRHALRAA